jgi:hypothetical protein
MLTSAYHLVPDSIEGYANIIETTWPLRSQMRPRTLKPSRKNEVAFSEIIELIASSRERALQALDAYLIEPHWQVGEVISRKVQVAE